MNQTVKKILQAKINWSNYPSLNSFKLFKDKAYVILFVADKELDIKNLSAAEISEIISKKFRKKVTHQAIRGALNPKIGDEVEAIQGENGVLNYSLLPKAYSIIGVTNNNANMNFTDNDIILPFEIFENTKDYIKKIIYEINGCYRDGYYNGCSILIRRLFETLIIEIYEKNKKEDSIKDNERNYFKLSKLIKTIINDRTINLSSTCKSHLNKIKLFGDAGAHSRKIILREHDIKKYKDEIRLSAEELLNELS